MVRFLILRLLQAIVVLWVMSFLVYSLIGLMPGDPVDLMISADPNVTQADAMRLKALYGLDRPILKRYANWLNQALSGDFGYSRLHARPVLDVIGPRLGNTVLLMSLALMLALVIAIPAGVAAARRPGSLGDRVINFCCFAGVSLPSFWFALVLILVFAVWLGVLPASGVGDIGLDGGVLDRLRHLVLPVIALSTASVAAYTRHIRASMLEVLREDYMRTARAKGVSEERVVWRHGLRNALIPVATILALDFGVLFSGALITETMFAYLGMGKTIFDAIMGNDYNLALVGLLLATLIVLVANMVVDMAYAWLDPRIARPGAEDAT
jgi:peptide/nickel transport system permease protein